MYRRAAAFIICLAAAFGAAAQDYRGPIRILVGYPPGGTIDNAARILADKMREDLGQTVIVENRPGAGGQIAVTALKSSPADGSVVLLANDHIRPRSFRSRSRARATTRSPTSRLLH